MLEQPNVKWIMKHAEDKNLRLELPSKNYSISAEQIYSHKHDLSSFIVQSGIKKSIIDFNPMYEAIVFIYAPATSKYSPKVYRPAANAKENFML